MERQPVDSRLEEAFEHLRNVPQPDGGRQAQQRQAFVGQVHRYQQYRSSRARRAPTRRWWVMPFGSRRMALAGALAALLLVMVAGTGVIYAADAAVPGDVLYGIDQTVESVRLGLTSRPQATARLLVSLAQERLAEAEELSNRGDTENLAVALDGFGTAVSALAQSPAGEDEADSAAVAALLNEEFAPQQAAPEASLPVLPVPEPGDEGDLELGTVISDTCVGAVPQPVAQRMADQYPGISYDDVMAWFCNGKYGMGEIMLAIKTAEGTGQEVTVDTVGGLLQDKTDKGGWGQVWQDEGLIGKGHKPVADGDDDDEDIEPPENEEVPDEEQVSVSREVPCVGADPHPVGDELAATYGISYTQVMSWFCVDNYGMGEIKIALEYSGTQVFSGTLPITVTAQSLLDMRAELGGWGQVWHALGFNGKPTPKKLADDEASDVVVPPGLSDEKPGNGPKVKTPKEHKAKPDAASKPKPDNAANPVKPDNAANPAQGPKTPKPVKPKN